MTRRLFISLAGMLAASTILSSQGHAESTPGEAMPVTATVLNSCDIGGGPSGLLDAGKLDFGSHFFGTNASLIVQATLPIRCNSTTATPVVMMDAGQNAGSGTQRYLKSSDGTLIAYDLLQGSTAGSPLWDSQGSGAGQRRPGPFGARVRHHPERHVRNRRRAIYRRCPGPARLLKREA